MSGKTNLKTSVLVAAFSLAMVSTAFAGRVIYVDADAMGANDGSSWADAYKYLTRALNHASGGDEIRVAQGVYKPNQGMVAVPEFNWRTTTFQLKNGVAIKGGYAGLGEPDPNTRDIELYETILSGDLDGNDVEVNDLSDLWDEPTRADNSLHVVTGSGTDATAALDGFTITGGNANGPGYWDNPKCHGGGMYNDSGSPMIINCIFSGNSAAYCGGMENRNHSSPTVTNCTFSGNYRGGMYNYYDSNPRLTDCVFSNNYDSSMYNYGSHPTVNKCIFSDNRGRGMHNYSASSPTLINCRFNGNSAHSGGGMAGGNPTLINCTFSGNSALEYGGGIYGGSPTLINCTFSGNTAAFGGGIANWFQGSPTLINCILWGNRDVAVDESAQILTVGGNPVISYSCIQGWTGKLGGTGNIGDDSLFVDADGADDVFGTEDDNLRLLAGSPCMNAGDNSAVPPSVYVDLDGNPRILNGVIDMGAYEGSNQGFLLSTKSVVVPQGGTATFTVALAMEPPGPIQVAVAHQLGDASISVLSGSLLTFDSFNYSLPQTVTLAATEDGDYFDGPAIICISAPGFATSKVSANEPAPTVLYVDDDAPNDPGPGDPEVSDPLKDGTQNHPLDSIQEAIDAAEDGCTIIVAQGSYTGNGNRDIDFKGKAITVRSESGPENCVIDCQAGSSEHRGFYFHKNEDANSVIEGLTITNGFACVGGGIYCLYSSPTLISCIFRRNSAFYDGEGGGMWIHGGHPTLINCMFIGNIAPEDASAGGLYNRYSGSPALINCAFIGNFGEGMVNWRGSPTIINCIFWSNGGPGRIDELAQLRGSDEIIINYSCVQGWTGDLGGAGNIDADPCFFEPGYWDANGIWVNGDYHLLHGSPCVDAGDPDYVAEPNETDLDGKPRVIGGRIDMGAYEYSPPIQAEARIVPRTINLQSKGKWITAFLWLPDGLNVADIDANSVLLEDEIGAESIEVNEERQIAMAKFSREQAQAILNIGEVELTITGRLTDGTVFEAKDVIIVINKGSRK